MITVKVIFIGRMVSCEQILDNAHVEVDDGTTLDQFIQKLSRKFSVDTSSTLILLNNKDIRYLPPDFKLSDGDTFSVISIIAGG